MKTSFLHARDGGVTISILVTPRSSKVGPLGIRGDMLRWGVAAAPVDGEANESLLRSISKILDFPLSRLSIVVGAKSKKKVIFVDGVSEAELRAKLYDLCPID